jgi:replication-associated recombination protein RarA
MNDRTRSASLTPLAELLRPRSIDEVIGQAICSVKGSRSGMRYVPDGSIP